MSDRTKILLLLTPALSIIILLFFGGLFIGLLRSFNYMPIIGLALEWVRYMVILHKHILIFVCIYRERRSIRHRIEKS